LSGKNKWFDALALSRDETICLDIRSQQTKLMLSQDTLSFGLAQSIGTSGGRLIYGRRQAHGERDTNFPAVHPSLSWQASISAKSQLPILFSTELGG